MKIRSIFPVRRFRRPATGTGFSLVEMLVAMALGLMLTAGVLTVVVNTDSSHREIGNMSRQIENGRYAMQVLRDDVRHAGFYGEFFDLTTPSVLPNPCNTDVAGLTAGVNLPIYGADSALSCLTGHVADTDVLVIRRAATASTPIDQLISNEMYVQTRPGALMLAPGSASTAGDEESEVGGNSGSFNLTQRNGSPAAIRRYFVHIYYIRNCSNCGGSGDGIPTLSRMELRNGSFASVPIADGIENMQLRYGLDDNGDGAPNRFTILPGTLAEWSRVVAVEANLLARAVDPSPGYVDRKTYQLGDQQIDATDLDPGFKRHVFTSVARAVNPSSRRE
jgi:type IV pilus assembly protein PilW